MESNMMIDALNMDTKQKIYEILEPVLGATNSSNNESTSYLKLIRNIENWTSQKRDLSKLMKEQKLPTKLEEIKHVPTEDIIANNAFESHSKLLFSSFLEANNNKKGQLKFLNDSTKLENLKKQHRHATLKSSLVASTQTSQVNYNNVKNFQKSNKYLDIPTQQNSDSMINTISFDKRQQHKDLTRFSSSSSSSLSNKIKGLNTSNSSLSNRAIVSRVPNEFQPPLHFKNHHKEPLKKNLNDSLCKSVVKYKSDEISIVVDQMASFIEELKDFIDDRLIDTTSQLELSNCHIYNLYISITFLIKELSSIKIKNEELKKELSSLNTQLIKSNKTFQKPSSDCTLSNLEMQTTRINKEKASNHQDTNENNRFEPFSNKIINKNGSMTNNYREIFKTNDNLCTGLKNQNQSKNIRTSMNKLDSNNKHLNNNELKRSKVTNKDIDENKFSATNSNKEIQNYQQLLKSMEIIKKEINKKNVINNLDSFNSIESQSLDLSSNIEKTKIKLHKVLCKSSLIHHLFSSLESFTNIDNGLKVKN